MIPYEVYCEIRRLRNEGLKKAQIARQLGLDIKTVERWFNRSYRRQQAPPARSSRLDPHKAQIMEWLRDYPFTGRQLFQRLQDRGYEGGYTTLTDFLRQVRPRIKPAFYTLRFEPGQCAQVDWGCHGQVQIGNTQRRLSFLAVVQCYSRMLYVEFAPAETQEHFLSILQHAFDYFGGVSGSLMVDNCKVAVLARPPGKAPVLHPVFLDFSHHYDFQIKACGVRQPQQKGRVESAVGYVKKSFLAGRELPHSLTALNAAARQWLDQTANVRQHGVTKERPVDLHEAEKPHLRPLPLKPYDIGQIGPVRVNRQFRVVLETNRYSVPARFAGQRLQMKLYCDRIRLYHQNQLVAEHPRSYERNQDFENPDHVRELHLQREKSSQQRLLNRFLSLSPKAEAYYQQLKERRLNCLQHIRLIVGLSEIHGPETVARALEDSLVMGAISSQYILNLIEQRERKLPEPGVLHVTRREDLLDLELPEPDLSVYDRDSPPEPS